MIELLAQVKKERERLYEQAKRGLEYPFIDIDNENPLDAPALANLGIKLIAMPNDLPEPKNLLNESRQNSSSFKTPTLTSALEID